jgi:integrase
MTSLTSYVSRHSWATIGKRKGTNIGKISQGLGHSDIKTTQIYMNGFDDEELDKANEQIINI